MKVTIEKVPEGVRLELHHSTAKKPLVVTLTPDQADALLSLLQAAARADVFKMTWET